MSPQETLPERKDTLPNGAVLRPGEFLLSPNGRSMFILQGDGNLVLYRDGGPVWSTETVGQHMRHVGVQGDGNCVLYRSDGSAAWASNTVGAQNALLILQDDGNLVLLSGDAAVWASDTVDKTWVVQLPQVFEESRRVAEGCKVQIRIKVSNNGSIDGNARLTNSQAIKGYKVGWLITLTDQEGNVLHTAYKRAGINAAGISRKNKRTVPIIRSYPPELAEKIGGVSILAFHAPRSDSEIKEKIEVAIKTGKKAVELGKEIAALVGMASA